MPKPELNFDMKIVADDKIPYLKGVLEPYAEVSYLPGNKITPVELADADVLITRTRTACNRELLAGSKVKLVTTATIGIDHINTAELDELGIVWKNAPGCNAASVKNYIASALASLGRDLSGLTLGIIGAGNVGKLVAEAGKAFGMKLLLNDPPRAEAEGSSGFCTLDELLTRSDIVTMHVPLDETTRGMADEEFFMQMPQGSIFINAARGEIMDDDALMQAIPKLGAVVIDTWNHEPDVNRTLVDMVDIATPHIAGYSYQGKQNGTASAVQYVARHFGIEALYDYYPEADIPDHDPLQLDLADKNHGERAAVFQYNYPIFTDDFRFRMDPSSFEKLRSEYQYRREIYI